MTFWFFEKFLVLRWLAKKKKRLWRARLLSTVAGAGFPPRCDVAYHANAIGKKQTDLLCVMAGCDISMDRTIHQWDRLACKWAHSKCQLGRLFEESLALNCCLIICSNNNSYYNNNNNSSTNNNNNYCWLFVLTKQQQQNLVNVVDLTYWLGL